MGFEGGAAGALERKRSRVRVQRHALLLDLNVHLGGAGVGGGGCWMHGACSDVGAMAQKEFDTRPTAGGGGTDTHPSVHLLTLGSMSTHSTVKRKVSRGGMQAKMWACMHAAACSFTQTGSDSVSSRHGQCGGG